MEGTRNAALKHAIHMSGLKQIHMAEQMGIAEVRLSRIVNGHVDVTESEKHAIAALLDRPVALLFPMAEAVAS